MYVLFRHKETYTMQNTKDRDWLEMRTKQRSKLLTTYYTKLTN